MSNRLIECGCGCTSTNTVRVHAGYRSTTMDCGKQSIECSSCHEPLEFYDNESWRFDEHLLESKEEKDLQGGPEARLKAWICNMQFTKCRAPEPEATRATAGERRTDASIHITVCQNISLQDRRLNTVKGRPLSQQFK